MADCPNPNQILVDVAAETLTAFHNITADRLGESREGGLTGEGDFPLLLANLMHLADARGYDFGAMLQNAAECYKGEVDHARQSTRARAPLILQRVIAVRGKGKQA